MSFTFCYSVEKLYLKNKNDLKRIFEYESFGRQKYIYSVSSDPLHWILIAKIRTQSLTSTCTTNGGEVTVYKINDNEYCGTAWGIHDMDKANLALKYWHFPSYSPHISYKYSTYVGILMYTCNQIMEIYCK